MSMNALGDITAANLFAYCGNDPVNYVDPEGEKSSNNIGKGTDQIIIKDQLSGKTIEEYTIPAANTAWIAGGSHYESRGMYACGPVALTNALAVFWNNGCWKKNIINGTLWDTFKNLWSYTLTWETNESKKSRKKNNKLCRYGCSLGIGLQVGVAKYAKKRGYNLKTSLKAIVFVY